ncbi:hypothetical protein BurJ1DRAFT_2454 [Burkholderiales bacterium JOSHI_001]|nr:hypothetical protein BurJ1DRAFT_2454 [Burkholderiales bacterium JOSHI_001]
MPALWAGVLLAVATLATPAPFATLARADAGRVVGHIFVREAWLSLVLAVLLLAMERGRARQAADSGQGSQFSTEMLLVLGTVFCTVAGYFGTQPLMAAARAGQGAFSFGQLHGISFGLFGLKILLVVTLAWRATKPAGTALRPTGPSS